MTSRTALLLALLSTSTGCIAELAPPPMPGTEGLGARVTRTSPPESGHTRVLLEADQERTVVSEVTETQSASAEIRGTRVEAHGESTRPVCIAPCAADLKPGLHILRFTSEADPVRTSDAKVQVDDTSKAVRHALGRKEDMSVGNIAAYSLLVLAASATMTMGGLLAANRPSEDPDAARNVRIGTAISGGALAISIPLIIFSRPKVQPGSTREVALAR